MDDPENEGLMSSIAESVLSFWRWGFDEDPRNDQSLLHHHEDYAQSILRWVRPTTGVHAAVDHVATRTIAFCHVDQSADENELSRLRLKGLAALNELERICRQAGLIEDAQALRA